ncbi:MBL fold metallo-hydrolase [Dethiosulfatarculus sandiegensis]|uniref:Metallo-beta-lactamase domain-containing protein n=1 Tax=Dethiosulfatarculus sandiegensis TaxID=1429043 RepID=A0A0D2JUP6_9BACT|nr:MBL fold metallo-hydrolase [Dethiosulfatarculus sandiegensis]KIX13255.1 hypothetical protein X474_14730 [Dethiosulfatarculus sandiegensis]
MTEKQALAKNVWRLGNHHIAAFFIKGSHGQALFEVGVGATAPLILKQMQEVGLDPEKPLYLIVSHSHADHSCGQAGLLKTLSGAILVMTEPCLKHLGKPAVARHFKEEDDFTTRALGLSNAADPLPLLPRPVSITRSGERLDLGGISLEFLSAQGHAPGGIMAWIPEKGVALCSDSAGFLNNSGQIFPLFFVSYKVYMEELQAIAKLNPQVVALGHQAWFKGKKAGEYLETVRQEMEQVRQGIRDRKLRGILDQDQAREMANSYYQGELTIYRKRGIYICCDLLVKRALEDQPIEPGPP